MAKLSNELVDEIATSCLDVYNALPKTGKPVENEWTVLSCVVQYDISSNTHEIVSLGTGSKCIGAVKMSPDGTVINDSHAEVLARRGFLLYLYDNMESNLKDEPSIFTLENSKFKLDENIEFIFYSSQMPCGDASIVPKSEEDDLFGDILQSIKRTARDEGSECKKLKLENDVYRTGAKCLPDSQQDPHEEGSKYHLLGQVRTKPGRGDRTLSLSCSDKIARWIHIGIHGALLDLLLEEPIYLKHFIFGSGVPYSEETLRRAFLLRHLEEEVDLKYMPEFYQTSVLFGGIRTKDSVRAAPGSIIWIKLNEPISEVAVQGKKLGVTKKKATAPSSSICISKYKLYEKFHSIILRDEDMKEIIFGSKPPDSVPYNQMKRQATRYLENWSIVKEDFFRTWTTKPDMWTFCIKHTK